MSGPFRRLFAPLVAPAMIRQAIAPLRTTLTSEFKIVPFDYTASTFLKSPAAKEIGWALDVHPEKTAVAFASGGPTLFALAQALGRHADTLNPKEHGQLHILDYFAQQSHAYLYLSPWYALPASVKAGTGLLATGDPNQFRALPWNFPSFKGELDDPAQVVQEPGGFLQSILGSTPVETGAQAEFRVKRWAGTSLGPFFQLGASSVVACENYVELVDEETGLIIRLGVMATSSFHVFDGKYSWLSVTDMKKRRTMIAGIGGGQHSIPEMDLVNPLGGAIVMSLTLRSYLAGLHAGLTVGAMSPAAYAAALAKADKVLGNQRFMMSQFDREGVAMALARQSAGMFVQVDKIVVKE